MTIAGGIIEPTKERRQRAQLDGGRIDEVVLQDEQGLRSIPWRAEGLLAQLERRGDIRPAECDAGEHFHRLFQRAALDPLRAADMGRIGSCGAAHDAHGSENARRQARAVIAAMGGRASLAGAILWDVVGEDRSIRHWALQHKRDPKVAKGILIQTLAQLARFWGM